MNFENLITTEAINKTLRSAGELRGRGIYNLSIDTVKGLGFNPELQTPNGYFWEKSILQEIIPVLDDKYPKTIKAIDVKVSTKGNLNDGAPKSIDDRLASIEQKLNKIIKLLM